MAKKVTVYEGAIRVLYADEFTLEKDKIVPHTKKVYVKNGLFYARFLKFISMDYDTVLRTEEEAQFYMNEVLKERKDIIKKFLTDPSISEDERKEFLHRLTLVSSSLYQDPDEIKVMTEMDKADFKILNKKFKEKANI